MQFQDEWTQAPLIDRLHVKLTSEKEDELNWWLDQKKEAIIQSRTKFMERQKKYLFNYDDFITYVRKGPWDGCSNIHLPLTQIMVSAQVAKLYNILSSPEVMTFTPRDEMDDVFVSALKKLYNWYIWDYMNEKKGIRAVLWETCFDTVTVGFGLCFKNWLLKERKTLVIEPNELKREMADIDPQIQAIAKENKDPTLPPEKKVNIADYKEVEKIVKEFEGTKLQSVPFERAFFPNDIPEVNNMNYPDLVILQTDTTLSEIKIKELQEEYREGSFDRAKGEDKQDTNTETSIKEHRDHLTGFDSKNMTHMLKERALEHCFARFDIDDDGVDEDLVITRTEKGTIVKAIHLNRISPTNNRPIYKFDCFPKSRQSLSRGVPEFMYQLNEKMDLNENMKQDYMQISLAPMFAFRSTSSLDNQKVRLSPGKGIPVDDVNQDIRILDFSKNLSHLFQDQAQDWQMADRMNSTSPVAQGQMPGVVGAQRSTSGILTMLKQMDNEFVPRFQVLSQEFKRLIVNCLEDLDFRVDQSLKARVLGSAVEEQFGGAPDFNSIIRITDSLDVSIDVASVVNSEEMKKNDAAIIYQTLSTPGIAHQFGVVTPKGVYNSLSDFLKLYGRDPEKYTDKPQFVMKELTLWQEIQVCAQGMVPDMSMQENHEQKSSDLQAFLESGEWQESVAKGLYVKNFTDIVGQAIQKHLSLAQALKAQAPNLAQGQQSNNTQLMSGTADQQGGNNPNLTTSRELNANSGNEQNSEEGTGDQAS